MTSVSAWQEVPCTCWPSMGRELVLLREAEALARACDDRARLAGVLAHWPMCSGARGDYAGALAVASRPSPMPPSAATSPCRRQRPIFWGRSTWPLATTDGRPSCSGGTCRRESLARGSKRPDSCSGVAGARLERARAVQREPALWGGGAPPGDGGRPREPNLCLPTGPSAICTWPKGTWRPRSACWTRA